MYRSAQATRCVADSDADSASSAAAAVRLRWLPQVEWSPFDANRLAVATAQNFGIVGQGKQYVLQMQHGLLVPTAVFDTAVSGQRQSAEPLPAPLPTELELRAAVPMLALN